MRKVLPIMLAIALAMPALANVTVTVAEGTAGDQKAELSLAIDGGSVVRGLAITVTVTNGSIDAIGDLSEVMAGFNAYIDYYYSNTGFLGTTLGGDEQLLPGIPQGAHALANPDAAGVLDLAAPKSVFSISLGALDNSGAQGGVTAGGILAKVALTIPADQNATVCLASDALRGGIVGDNLGTVTVDATCATITGPVSDCFNNNLGNLAEWISFGKPNCWCYERNCNGDADGKAQGTTKTGLLYVYTNDLNILTPVYNVAEPPKGAGVGAAGICADFARDAQGTTKTGLLRVYTNDLNLLTTNYNKAEPPKGVGVPLCPLAGAGGEITFYKYPAP